jgi:hypothetical protein
VHRRGTPVVLLGLFAVHAAVDAFLSPIGGGVGQIDVWALVRVAAMGVVVVQPVLLAIGAVLWPTRAAIRIPVTLTATVLLAYANFFGIARNAGSRTATDVNVLAMMLIEYSMFVGLLLIITRLRHWQALPEAAESRFADKQFSLYGLAGGVTTASLVFGLGNWVLPLVAWPSTWALWHTHLVQAFRVAMVLAVPCLPIIPCTLAVLAPTRSSRQIFWALGSVTAASAIFASMVISFAPQPATGQDVAIFCSVLLGVYVSAVFSLFVVRLCGLRLMRRPNGQSASDGHQSPPNPAAIN